MLGKAEIPQHMYCRACPRIRSSFPGQRKGPSRCNWGGFVEKHLESRSPVIAQSILLRKDIHTNSEHVTQRIANERGVRVSQFGLGTVYECQHRRPGEAGVVVCGSTSTLLKNLARAFNRR